MSDDLKERLLQTTISGPPTTGLRLPINPTGEEAAARITTLEAKFAEAVEAIETMQAQAAGTPNHPFCAMVIETGNDALARLRDGEGE